MLITQGAVHPWLTPFPAPMHGTVEGWFRHVVTRGGTGPARILGNVTLLVEQALSWSATPARRQLCHDVLRALHADPDGAVRYAQSLVGAQGA